MQVGPVDGCLVRPRSRWGRGLTERGPMHAHSCRAAHKEHGLDVTAPSPAQGAPCWPRRERQTRGGPWRLKSPPSLPVEASLPLLACRIHEECLESEFPVRGLKIPHVGQESHSSGGPGGRACRSHVGRGGAGDDSCFVHARGELQALDED